MVKNKIEYDPKLPFNWGPGRILEDDEIWNWNPSVETRNGALINHRPKQICYKREPALLGMHTLAKSIKDVGKEKNETTMPLQSTTMIPPPQMTLAFRSKTTP